MAGWQGRKGTGREQSVKGPCPTRHNGPYQKGFGPRLQQLLGTWLHGGTPDTPGDRLMLGLGKLLYRLGLVRYSRDLTAIHKLLYKKGLATPLGETFNTEETTAEDELARVTGCIRKLL